MKIVTYPSYGSVLPIALEDFFKSTQCENWRTDLKLFEFLDKSISDYVPTDKLKDLNVLIKCLEYQEEPDADGIKRVYYHGWSKLGCEISVCVNEYDENTMKVIIEEYDGSERLTLLREYVPVEGIPGLYEREDPKEFDFQEND